MKQKQEMKVNKQASCRLIQRTHFPLQQMYLKRMSTSFNNSSITDRSIHSQQVVPTCTTSEEVPAVTEVQEHSAFNSPSQLGLSRNGALQIALITSQVPSMEPKYLIKFQVQFQDQAVKTLVIKLQNSQDLLMFFIGVSPSLLQDRKIRFSSLD